MPSAGDRADADPVLRDRGHDGLRAVPRRQHADDTGGGHERLGAVESMDGVQGGLDIRHLDGELV